MVNKENKHGKEIFVILDANSIVHRAFHSYPATLQTSSGLQVNAVFGFSSMFLKVLEFFEPKYILCAFDTAKPTFRHTIYTDYKATRKPTDQSLIDQFPVVEEVVKAFNVPILKREGYEADDIIGTISEYIKDGKWSKNNIHLCIVSSDTDLLQLVSENVSVILPQGNFKNLKEFMREEVFEKFSVFPEQIVDYKALVGDPSDNIPGVKGIGSKTTIELLQTYGSVEKIYSNLDSLKSRTKKLLEEGIEQASLSKELAQIFKEVDLKVNLEECLEKDFDRSKVIEKFIEFEFKTLITKIPDSIDQGNEIKNNGLGQIGLFENISENVKISDLKQAPEKLTEGFVLFLSSQESTLGKDSLIFRSIDRDGVTKEFLVEEQDFDSFVSYILKQKGDYKIYFYNFENFLTKVNCNIKEMLKVLRNVYEIKVLAHIESSSRKVNFFSDLCFEYISKHVPEVLSLNNFSEYFDYLKEIYLKIESALVERSIEQKLLNTKLDFISFTSETENVLSLVLSSMEKRGILMDEKILKRFNLELEKELQKLEEEIYYDIGHAFNINSPKQLADILFNELGLIPMKKTKTSYSTKEEVLKKLEGMHPAISKIMEYRHKGKIMSTYVKVYLNSIDTKIIHTDFKQTGTTSGRLSSVNPNMQNLPIGDEIGRRLREIFIPRKNFVLLSADYSQIDLRAMAHISGDLKLIEDFDLGKDIHLRTASRILKKPEEEITSNERKIGKTINFGIIYGLTSFGLSESLKVSVSEAKEYINEYFENYSGVAEYINNLSREAQEIGYVQTILGRRRYVPGVNSKNLRVKNSSIREAINMPVQGTSADIMKLAITEIFKLILEKYPKNVFMLLQIHDEIIFEVQEDVLEDFQVDVKDIMENVINLKVPLLVNISFGKNMSELK